MIVPAIAVAQTDHAQQGQQGRGQQTVQGQSGGRQTNTNTGTSTLGPDVSRVRPDQGQPVTSKGHTVRQGSDLVREGTPPLRR